MWDPRGQATIRCEDWLAQITTTQWLHFTDSSSSLSLDELLQESPLSPGNLRGS